MKSGCNLGPNGKQWLHSGTAGEIHSLVLSEAVTIELLAFSGNVDPQAALTTDGAGTFNGKANIVGGLGGRRKVDVTSRDIGMTCIAQWEVVDFLGARGILRTHDEF